MNTLIYEPLDYCLPNVLFEVFAHQPWAMLFESANANDVGYGTNGYSYVLFDPFETFVVDAVHYGLDPLERLKQLSRAYSCQPIDGLPPFQGGMAGYLSYELAYCYQPVENNKYHRPLPSLCVGFYDVVIAFHHQQKKAYLIASGLPEQDPIKRQRRAHARMDAVKSLLSNACRLPKTKVLGSTLKPTSNLTKAMYLAMVQQTKEHILAGDIFQANVSQQYKTLLPDGFDDYALYQELCLINPAPFAAYANFGDHQIISASPERFIQCQNHHLETRPIKGTRARGLDDALDKQQILGLTCSEKDRAEHMMIVDLMRNDLSRVCMDHSVLVKKLCAHEQYPTVHHLVSVICGQLKPELNALDVLKALIPGGSITGAPKIRAMQIIAALEPHTRGPYCGNMVLLGFDGYMDSSILIRSFVREQGVLYTSVGGAVVLDSSPEEEYQETLVKSQALFNALNRVMMRGFVD